MNDYMEKIPGFFRLHKPPKKCARPFWPSEEMDPKSKYYYDRPFARYLKNPENKKFYDGRFVSGEIGSVDQVRFIISDGI